MASRPRAIVCYICGRSYGTASIEIHLKSCTASFLEDQKKKPVRERLPLPTAPTMGLSFASASSPSAKMAAIDAYNQSASASYTSTMEECAYCGRRFATDRLVIHNKSCTPEHPSRPVGAKLPGGGGGGGGRASSSNAAGGGTRADGDDDDDAPDDEPPRSATASPRKIGTAPGGGGGGRAEMMTYASLAAAAAAAMKSPPSSAAAVSHSGNGGGSLKSSTLPSAALHQHRPPASPAPTYHASDSLVAEAGGRDILLLLRESVASMRQEFDERMCTIEDSLDELTLLYAKNSAGGAGE